MYQPIAKLPHEIICKLLEDVERELATVDDKFYADIYERDLAILKRRLLPLLVAGQQFGHREIEDCWYSCPAHPDCCSGHGACTCGYAEYAAALEEALGEQYAPGTRQS